MNATQQLHALGQSLWLDNITHALLTSGTLDRYIRELAVTGLTSNPTIFDHAIRDGVASVFVSRWDVAVKDKVPDALRNRLGIAVAVRTYKAYRELLGSSADRSSPPAGPCRSACCGAAPGPRIPRPPMASTSKRWRLRTRSIPCPRRRCSPSPIMAK